MDFPTRNLLRIDGQLANWYLSKMEVELGMRLRKPVKGGIPWGGVSRSFEIRKLGTPTVWMLEASFKG